MPRDYPYSNNGKNKSGTDKKGTEFLITGKESHNIKYTPRHKINDMSLDDRTRLKDIWKMGYGVEDCKCAYCELLMWNKV